MCASEHSRTTGEAANPKQMLQSVSFPRTPDAFADDHGLCGSVLHPERRALLAAVFSGRGRMSVEPWETVNQLFFPGNILLRIT